MRFPRGSSARVLLGAAFCCAGFAGPVVAQDAPATSLPLLAQAQNPVGAAAALQTFVPTAAPQTSATSSEVTTTSIERSLGPAGDPFGVRAALRKRGIEFNFTYVAETLGNPTGGFKRGATFEGRLDGELTVDLEKLAGLKGLSLHSNFYQIHGRGLSKNNLQDLYTISGIEAPFTDTKLYEAWLEQKLFNDKIAVAAGQFAGDADFIVSQTASIFVNSSYGYPVIYSNNLPSGGISYPFASPGVRLRFQPNEHFTFTSLLYDGDPAGTNKNGVLTSPLSGSDRGGISFRLRDAPLLYNEAQFLYNNTKDSAGLPGTLKIGYFHHFDKFTLFNVPPGVTATTRGNDGAYAVLDQSIYKEQTVGKDDPDQGASIFLRVLGAPQDRNLIDFQIDGGIAYKGLLPQRDEDTIALSAAYAHISPDVTRLDIASRAAPLIRDYQALVEATYQFVVTSGFTVQPDFQYVIHPGANGVADPYTGQPLRNALVFGLRSTIIY